MTEINEMSRADLVLENMKLTTEVIDLKKELRDVYQLVASRTKRLDQLNKDNPNSVLNEEQ